MPKRAAASDGAPQRPQGGATQPGQQQPGSSHLAALHRSRCWEWSPSAVVAIAACPDAPLAVVGLESGDLELWDLGFMVCLQRVVGFNTEVTALAWARDSLDKSWRTFAAALDGSLAEVSWKQAALIAATDSGAGTVWSLAAQPVHTVRAGFSHQLAAACDDGTVRIFSVEAGEPGLVYERTLARTQGRVLTVAWHPAGTMVVAGGADGCIHALDATTGIEQLRITVSASTTQPVCVWRLLVLPDGTLVSGDSGGAVQFWDGRFGSLLQRFTIHSADILALATSPDATRVWASGVDSQVALFERCANASGLIGSSSGASSAAQWVYTHYKRPHTHDVRALEVVHLGAGQGAVLLSGSADAQLMLYPVASFLQVHPARLTKCPQAPLCQLSAASAAPATAQEGDAQPAVQQTRRGRGARAAAAPPPTPVTAGNAAAPRRLLCVQREVLDVWQLGATALTAGHAAPAAAGAAGAAQEGEALDLVAAPRRLAQIKCKGARVRAAAISPDSRHVACAVGSQGSLRVYQLEGVDAGSTSGAGIQAPQVLRAVLDAPLDAVTAVALTARHLFAAQHDGRVHMIELPPPAGSTEQQGEEDEPAPSPAQPRVAAVCTARAWEQQGAASGLHASKAKPGGVATWRTMLPAVTCLHASPDGSMVAAAGPQGIVLMRVAGGGPAASVSGGAAAAGLQQVGKPIRPPRDAPITCLSFSADARQLAATLADGHLLVLDVASGRPSAWSLEHDTAVAACLHRLPGTPHAVCFAPTQAHSSQLVVHSAGGFCVLDTQLPVQGVTHPHKRRRGAQKPAWGPQSVAGAGPVTDAGQGGGAPAQEGAGGNGRVVLLPDPVAFVGYLGPSELLLLEQPWEDVVAALSPPLFKPRYGS